MEISDRFTQEDLDRVVTEWYTYRRKAVSAGKKITEQKEAIQNWSAIRPETLDVQSAKAWQGHLKKLNRKLQDYKTLRQDCVEEIDHITYFLRDMLPVRQTWYTVTITMAGVKIPGRLWFDPKEGRFPISWIRVELNPEPREDESAFSDGDVQLLENMKKLLNLAENEQTVIKFLQVDDQPAAAISKPIGSLRHVGYMLCTGETWSEAIENLLEGLAKEQAKGGM